MDVFYLSQPCHLQLIDGIIDDNRDLHRSQQCYTKTWRVNYLSCDCRDLWNPSSKFICFFIHINRPRIDILEITLNQQLESDHNYVPRLVVYNEDVISRK